MHLVIFSILSIGMTAIIFILSLFNTPHPDAYKDGVMSIVYVYVIVLIVHLLIYIIKRITKDKGLPNRLIAWHKETSVLIHIAIGFTFITVLNNIMMVTDIDTPKTGTFAYAHLLVRTLIVTIAVVIWMYKDVLNAFSSLQSYRKETKENPVQLRKYSWMRLKNQVTHNPIIHSMTLFALITIVGCIVMVLFSPLIKPQGGYNLYASLLVLYAIVGIYTTLYHFIKRRKAT